MHMVAFKAAGGSTDSTPPTVAITAPNNGANVSDITQLTANANDNVGVAGVRFLVDGQPEGAEDTSAPYGLSWDTRGVANGAHTLTARARDAAGNTTTSAPIAVNVANSDYFQNEVLATGFNLPTTFEFLPDGRLLVAELAGRIKILSPPYTQADPGLFLQINNIGSAGVQQGIYDLVLDPNFASNHFYYVFYTLGSPNHDRVSRFTANASLTGTVAGSEFVLYEDPQNADAEHHGGALSFANDGKLLFTTGEHFQAACLASLRRRRASRACSSASSHLLSTRASRTRASWISFTSFGEPASCCLVLVTAVFRFSVTGTAGRRRAGSSRRLGFDFRPLSFSTT